MKKNEAESRYSMLISKEEDIEELDRIATILYDEVSEKENTKLIVSFVTLTEE